ncbi:MAG: hypothetical protein Q8S33_11680 [Myxococcales bacterium]|nr:hypothetical protein [Myxococcales bacterium]
MSGRLRGRGPAALNGYARAPLSTTDSLDSGQTIQRAPAPTSVSDAPPQGAGRYETIGTLGEGGMGRVLEAVDTQFSRVVAIKELRRVCGAS